MQVLIGLPAVISRRSWRLIQLWMEEVSLVRLIMRSCYLIELSIGSFALPRWSQKRMVLAPLTRGAHAA